MSKIRNYPTSGVRSGRVLFRYNEIELYPRAEQHIFSKQHYSMLQIYGRRNLVSGTSSPHLHTDTYLHTHRFKKVILASVYPKEMHTVLAMYIIIKRVDIPSSVFTLFAEAARSIPTPCCPKPPIMPRQHCGMAIREQTWILTPVTFGLNTQ